MSDTVNAPSSCMVLTDPYCLVALRCVKWYRNDDMGHPPSRSDEVDNLASGLDGTAVPLDTDGINDMIIDLFERKLTRKATAYTLKDDRVCLATLAAAIHYVLSESGIEMDPEDKDMATAMLARIKDMLLMGVNER